MNISKQCVSWLLLCIAILGYGVGIESTETTFFIGQTQEITFIGLTTDTQYIVVYSSVLENYTFQASGYRYTYKLQLPEISTDTLTLSIYEYSTVSGQNSSAVLYSRIYQIERYEDYSFLDTIIPLIPFLFPIVIAGMFVGLFIKLVKR